jgi:hypothetical protein
VNRPLYEKYITDKMRCPILARNTLAKRAWVPDLIMELAKRIFTGEAFPKPA